MLSFRFFGYYEGDKITYRIQRRVFLPVGPLTDHILFPHIL